MSAKLGELLVKEGLISPDQLEAALENQKEHGGKIGECLVRLGFISEQYILATLSIKYHLSIIDLDRVEIDRQAAHVLPLGIARRHRCIAISRAGATLSVAMVDPLDFSLIDELKFRTGYRIEAVLSREAGIISAIERAYHFKPPPGDLAEVNHLFEIDDWTIEYPEFGRDRERSTRPSATPFAVTFSTLILKNAVCQGASDIHVETHSEMFRLRFRVDGLLKIVCQWPFHRFDPSGKKVYSLIGRFMRLAGITTSRALPAIGRIQVFLKTPTLKRHMTVEVSVLPTVSGEKVVLRPLEDKKGRLARVQSVGSNSLSTDIFPGWSKDRKLLALFAAAQRGQIDQLRGLLSSGVNVNVRNYGLTALMAAAQKGQAVCVRELLEHGADANAKDSGMTALAMAAFNGHVETVRALLEHGNADLSFCIEAVLNRCAVEDNAAMIRMLVECELADVDSALWVACEFGRIETIEWLLRQGAVDVTAGLERAVRSGQVEAVQMLLENAGQKVKAAYLKTAIENLIEGWELFSRFWHPSICSLMLRGTFRHDVLRKIAESYTDTLKVLLEEGAEAKNVDPVSLDTLARRRGSALLRLLFEAGAEVPPEHQQDMLLFAVQTADVDTVSALLDAGTPVGAEALRWMMGDDRRKILRLLRKREDVAWKEDEMDRALVWAIYYGHTDIANRLCVAGATVSEERPSGFDQLQWNR